MTDIITKTYTSPEFSLRTALRYAGCREAYEFDEIVHVLHSESEKVLRYAVCYTELPIAVDGIAVSFGSFSCKSKALAKNLEGCTKAVVFAATIGLQFDRLVMAYSRTSPSKAVLLQGIGAERIEALCDIFNREISETHITHPRFSPGYGDLPLSVQRDIFTILNPERHIGLTLTDSLMMSPTKSVSAIIGIEE